MSKELVIRNGFLLYNGSVYSQVITGVTDISVYGTQSNSLIDNDYTIVTEQAIKTYVDSKIAASGNSVGPNGTIQISDGGSNFTGYTTFSYDNVSDTLTVGNIDGLSTLTATTAYLSNLGIDSTLITTIVEDTFSSPGDNSTLATTSAITSFVSDYVASELANYSSDLSGLTDTTINSPTDGDLLIYQTSTEWTNTGISYLYTTLDNIYVNVDGDTMTGDLIMDTGANITLTQGNIEVQNGNVTILGDLYVSGTTTTINSTDLNIADNIIRINSGETGSGVTLNEAGIVIERGQYQDYYFIFKEDVPESETGGTFRIGLSGDTQAVATREDDPTSNGIAYWNDTEKRFDTNTNLTFDGSTVSITGDITITGTVDGVDISDFYADYLNFTGTTNTLAALNDTNISQPETLYDILQWDGSDWINSQNLNVAGTANITGLTTLSGNLDVSGTATIDNLNVSNTSTFIGLVNIDGGLDATGQSITGLTAYFTNLNISGTEISSITTDILSAPGDNSSLATTSAVTSYVLEAISNSGISIQNNVDNYLLTATGDNNTVKGNSGFTFDGTDVTISSFAGTGNRLVYADSTGKLVETDEYVYKTESNSVGVGTDTIDTISTAITYGTVWHYTVVKNDGSAARSGIITAIWATGSTQMNETSTQDIGDTTDVEFDVVLSGTDAQLQATIIADTWDISVVRMII
jgi:hypothetical protein